MVFVRPPDGVSLLRVAVWGLGVGLLDREDGLDVFWRLCVHGHCVCPYPWGVYAVWCLGHPPYWVEGVVGVGGASGFLEEVPSDVLPSALLGVCVVFGGVVGDDDCLPRSLSGNTAMGADGRGWEVYVDGVGW